MVFVKMILHPNRLLGSLRTAPAHSYDYCKHSRDQVDTNNRSFIPHNMKNNCAKHQ
jgi:hypothetical protein